MTGTRKSGKAGGAKGQGKRNAAGTRTARPAAAARARTVDARKESAEKYKFLIDATNTGYVILDDRGRVLDANQEYVRMTGRGKLADVLGRPVTDWTASYDLERNAAEVRKCMETGSVRNLVVDYVDGKGKAVPVEINATVLPGPGAARIFTVCRDITDRKRADQEIAGREALLQQIMDTASVAIFLVDREGRITHANKRMAEMFGRPLPELIGLEYIELVHPSERDIGRKKMLDLLASQIQSVDLERHYWRKDGTEFWGHLAGKRFHDLHGSDVGLIGVITDIDTRKRTEESLRESEEKFRLLVETTYDWIWAVDSRGMYTYASPRVRDLLGYAPAEVVGKTPFDLMPPDERERLGERFRGLVRRREPLVGLENTNLHKDGRRIVLETTGLPVFDDAGTFKGYRGIDRDITDRKHAEETLRESEAKYRLVVENATEGILIAQDGKIKFANPWMRAVGGYSAEDLLAKPFSQFVHPEDREFVYQQHLRRLKGEIPLDHFYDFRVLTKGGGVLWVEMKGAVTSWEGRPASVNFISNITERKKAEIALRDSENRTRSIIESIPVGMHMYRLEPGGRLVFTGANSAADRILGVDNRIFVGKTIEEAFPPLAATEVPRRYREVVESGTPWQTESIEYKDNVITGAFEVHAFRTGPDTMVAAFEVITERKRAELIMRESEAKYRRLYNETPVMMHSIDHNGDLVDVNDHWLKVMGYGRQEVIGRNVSNFHTPASVKYAREVVQPAFLRDGVVKDVSYQFVKKNGEIIDVLVSATGERDAEGRVVRSRAVIEDVTERKRAELALRISQEQLWANLNNTPNVAVQWYDEDGCIRYWNPASESLFGWKADDAMGKTLDQLIHTPVEAAAFLRILSDIKETGKPYGPFESPFRRRDGSEGWLLSTTFSMPMAGKRVGFVCMDVDITDRKRAADALRQSEERFRDLAQTLPLTIFELDLQGRLTYVNRAALEKFGYTQQDVETGVNVTEVVAPQDRDRAGEDMVRRISGGGPLTSEYLGLRKDGSTFPVMVASNPILQEGRPAGLRGIVMDLTDRKQLEEERLKAQKLESIGTLAGGIAHDFNNLLQGLFGYLSMARLTYDDRERSLAMLQRAEEALHRAVGLTSQLLTFSKGGQPVKKVVALRPIVEDACRFALSGSRTVFRIEADDGLWSVEADEGQIGQVIQNIALNADQAMPLGGTVAVHMRNIPEGGEPASGAEKGKHVEISIRDSGVGIPGEYLAKIFDPYFTTKEKGSGLGLATSYSIIKNHGGTISVSSEPGKGSTFTIKLPAVDVQPEAPTRADIPAGTRTGRVLVMDDEEIIRTVAIELIRSLGHEVDVAENGEKALELFLQARTAGSPFDVVVLDLTVRGGMGGEEAVRRLREIDPAVKAVVSSGYSDDTVVANYREHGFTAFLKKPYNLTGLREALGKLLQ